MKFRSVIFWVHLACGVTAGLVIFMMSATGVLLTYERQITAWFDKYAYTTPDQATQRMPITGLLAKAREHVPDITPAALTISSDPTAPVTVQLNRARILHLNPYTGAILGEGNQGIRSFFHAVTGWHRWFNTEGTARGTARAITGACNLVFLILVISGMYLWLPRRFKWPFFRGVLLFNSQAKTGRARDYNWHHVFGIWSSIPLLIVIATAVVFSYPWANNLVFRSVGEEPARRGLHGPGPETGFPGREGRAPVIRRNRETETGLTLDALFERAARYQSSWNTITILGPDSPFNTVSFTIDQGNGGQPQKRQQLTMSRNSGEVIKWEPFNSQSSGRRLRTLIRFLHTGEALGIAGQTIAGLVSLTALIMVWTGFALAYRRLVVPLFRKT
jgi:uncharacterized iron-regulated membrane protein